MEGNPSVEDGWREMNILLCPKCNLKTSDPALFQAHHCKPKSTPMSAVVSYNRENDKYTCCICKVELPESEFSLHLEIHISLYPYKCGYCNTKASSPIDMQQHLVLHHGGSVHKYFLQMSQTTKEVMLKAKNNGRALFKARDKVLLDQAASGKDKSVTNTARSQASVAVSEPSQEKVTATPLLHSVPPPLNAGNLVPPVIQLAALGVHSHVPSLQIYNSRTCSTISDQQRFILPAPKTFPQNASLATSSSENICQNPASLPYTQTRIPDLSQGLASSRIQERQPFVSNNLPIFGHGVQFCITDTQMASTAPLGFVSKDLHSNVPPAAGIIDGPFRNSALASSSFNHQHVKNNSNTVNPELSVANGSRIMSLHNDSNTTTSEGYPAVSNLSAYAQQGCSETTVQRNVSPTVVNSDWPTRIIIQNVTSLPAEEDECEQNLALGTTLNDEPTTTNVKEQESTVESEDFSFLRVVKVYFLCLKCKIKWRNAYDLFFKHIWQKHVHKMDFSCCPMGYSTDCARLKAVVRAIYDKSQEPMSDEIRRYFNQNSVDSCTDSENTLFPEQCIYSSTAHSNPVCMSSSSKTQSQPDEQSTSATSMNQRHIHPQNLSMEAISCHEESCPPNTAFNYQKQLRAPALSYAWENVQNQITTDLASENEGFEVSLPSLDQVVRRQIPSEAIASTAGVVEALRCLPEQQLLNASHKTLNNTSLSINSRQQESKMPATIYEDISNDAYDYGSSSVHGSNILLGNDQYTDDLPLDLSKKAPQTEMSVIPTPPSSVNESHITCPLARMDRISTESLEITDDNETTLKFFYQCGFHGCLFAAHKSLDFQAHYQQTHVSENQFPCIYCGLRNSSSKHLIDHMEEHIRNTKSKTFSCSLLQNSDKVVHVENNDIKFILRMLSTSFDANSDSGVDLRCTCNICCSEFGSLEELEDHLQKSLLKVIECKHCNSYFLNCYSWQRHMITEHPDLPRMYNINKKLLCYDCKMNTNSIDTETTRSELETNPLRNESESQNVNQSNDMSPVQTECEERIHMVLPVHSQNNGINYPQDSVNSRPINLMEPSSRSLETPFAFMNTLKSSDATNNTGDFRTNLQKTAGSDRRDISYGHPLTNTDSSRRCINYGQQLTNTVSDYGQQLSNAVSDYGQPLTKVVSYYGQPLLTNAVSDYGQPPTNAVNDYGQPQTHTVHARRDSHDNEQPLTSVSIRNDSQDNGQPLTSVSSRRDSQDNGQHLTSVSTRRGSYMNEPVLAHNFSNISDCYGNGQPHTPVSTRIGSQDNGQYLTRIGSQDNGQHLTRIDSQDNGQHFTSVSSRRGSQDNGQHLTSVSSRRDSQDNWQHLTSVSSKRGSYMNEPVLRHNVSNISNSYGTGLPLTPVSTRIGSQDNGQHLTRRDSQENEQPLTSVSSKRDSQDNEQPLTSVSTRRDSQDNEQPLTPVSTRRGSQDNGQPLTSVSTRRDSYMNEPVLAHNVSNIRDSNGNKQPPTPPVISKKDNSVCEQSLTQTISVRADSSKAQTQMHTINILDGSPRSSLNPECIVSEHTLPKITELITDALMISGNSNSLTSVKEVSRAYHCVNTTLEQGIKRTNCCEIINSEHTSSTLNGVQAMDDNLKSNDELNVNSDKVTDDQIRCELTDEMYAPPVAVTIAYSSNQTPESLQKEKEQTSMRGSAKLQPVAEMCTPVTADTQCSLVSVCEKDLQQAAILAPCIKQLPERKLTSNKPDDNEAMFQQSDGDVVLDSSICQSTDGSQKGTPDVSNLTVIYRISAAVETVEDCGLKHKVGSGSCLSQISNNLTLDQGSVDLPTGSHINNERSHEEVACLVHSQNSGGEGTVVTKTIENMDLDTESSSGLQQDFSQSKTRLGAKPIKRNKLSNINSIPSKSNTMVKTEEHTRYSDLRKASGSSTALEENHKEELLTPPSSRATEVKETVLHELSTSNKAQDNVSNSIKNTDSNPVLNMQKFKQSRSNHHAVLPQMPPIQTKNSNSLDLAHCKCGSGNHDSSAKDNQSVPNTDQSQIKMASKKCGKCKFTALWNKSTLKSNKSSQLTQKDSPACQQTSLKARIAGKFEPSELHCTLFDQCGSAVLDKCLKPLYEFTGGIYVCKRCKQKVLTMKRIHCHNFYCQGNIGVAHCSVCPFQGENEYAVEVHIKQQHSDSTPNITAKFRCIHPSELMKILQSQPVSSDTFMDVCAKLPLSKHARNSGMNPLVTREIALEDRPLFINVEEGGSLVSTEHKGMQINSAEKAQKNMNTKGRKVSPKKKADSVKMDTLITSTNIMDCTSTLSPTVEKVKSHNPSTTLSVISENGKQAKIQEISTVLLSDKVIATQNLDTLAAGKDEENRTPDISSSEQINKSIYNASPLKRMLHNKGVSETRKLNHRGSGVKRKSECTSEEISGKKTTSGKEEIAKSFGGLVDNPSDKNSMSGTNNSDNTTNVNSKYRLLKEKSKDKCVEGIQNSEMSKLDHTTTGTSVCKQFENRHDKGVNISKTTKDIAASCKDTAPLRKSNSKSSEIIRSIEEIKMCKSNPLINEQETTPEVMCSASEISNVVQTVSSVVRFVDTISVKDATLSDKEKVRHEATRTCEIAKSSTMDVISHADTAGDTKSENRHIKKVISNAFKSARENQISQLGNKKSVPKISDTEINDNTSTVTRKFEKSLSAEDTAAKTTKTEKQIKIVLKQKSKDRNDEVIGAHISKLDNKIQVKFNDTTVEIKPKSTTAGLDECIGTECVDITCSPLSDGGICAQKTTSCNTNSKDNCNVTAGNRQLMDSGSRKSSTTGMTPSDNKENNNTEKGLPGSQLDKDGQDTLKAVKVAKPSEEVSAKQSAAVSAAVRGKSQNRSDGDTIASETPKTDSVKVSCNDTTVRRAEREHEREGTKSVTSRQNIKVSHSNSVARGKSITVKQKGMSDSQSSKVIKEIRLTPNNTDIRKPTNHPKSAEIKKSNSQLNDSNSTDKRKSLEGLDERITSHEIKKLVEDIDTVEALDTFEELDNILSGTEVLQPSENGYSERTRFPEGQQSDKLAKVICSDETAINQSKSKHEDLSCIQTTWPCKKIKISHDSYVEIMTKDAKDGNVQANKITQITKGTKDLSSNTAVKRKSEERLEKPSKQCKSEAVQFPNEAHDTDLDILDPTPNTNSSVSESTLPCPSLALKNHIKPNKNKSLSRLSSSSSQPVPSSSVQLVPSSSSQPVPSNHLARKKRNDIYRCLNPNCDFTCKWNIDTMRGHINSKHPYFSCGYCDAPYTLTLLLENHQKFVHRGMEPNIVLGTISLNLLFKKINDEHSIPCGNGNMEVTDNRSQLLQSSPKKTQKKPKTNSDCQLTVSKNTEKQGLSLNLEGKVRNKQPIEPVGNKVPSRIGETFEEEDESQTILQARKGHTDMRKQSKPESIFEQLQMEVQLASGHEETTTEKLTNFSTINATLNGSTLSAKADRNLFEGSSFMNNVQFYLEASNASKNNNNKGINMANTEGSIAGKTATYGIPLAKLFKLRLPEGSIRLKKSVQKEPVSLHDSQLIERKVQSNNDLNKQHSLVSLSDVSKTAVSMENLPPHETVYQDALKVNSGSPLTSIDAYNLHKTALHPKMSKSAAFFIKNNKLAKFKSASTINNFQTYSQRRLPSVKIKKSQLIDISQASNLSPGNANDHDDRQKAQRITKTFRKDLSEDTNAPNKAMAVISSLKVRSEQNCGTWTVNQMETKTAAEGVQNIAFEPENMSLNFRKESLHNRSNLTTHSLFSTGKKPPTKDAVLSAASDKGKREVSKTEYPFRCTLCRRIVKCLNDIEEHFLECHPTDMVQLTERISGFVYSSSGELLDRKNCRKVPGLSHMCKYCPFRSTKRSDVEDHISVAHPLKNVLVFSLGKTRSPMHEAGTEITFEAQGAVGVFV